MSKVCNKCQCILDVSNFSKNKNRKDGLQSRCKNCCKTEQSRIRKNNKIKWAKREPDYTIVKKCSVCKCELLGKFFDKNNNKSDGLSTECRECDHKRTKKKRELNVLKWDEQTPLDGQLKKCSMCNRTLLSEEFRKNKTKTDGFSTECRECSAIINDRSREKYTLKNANVNVLIEYKTCPNCNTLKLKDGFFKNQTSADGLSGYCIECSNEQRKIRLKTNPAFKLRSNVSAIIRDALTRQHVRKNNSVWKYLPYTPQQLKEHIEEQWEPWMNWDNHGVVSHKRRTWQIDHIIPQSKLVYDSLEHPNFQKCWALDNLRPLDAFENISRNSKKFR